LKEIISAFLKTGSASIVSIFFNLVTNKLIAVFIGPYGFGAYSIFRQLQQTFLGFATLGGKTAIIEGIGSSTISDQKKEYQNVVTTIFVILAIVMVLLLFFVAPWLNDLYFIDHTQNMTWEIRGLALAIVFNLLYFLVASILNAYKAIGKLAILTSSIAITNFVFVLPFIFLYQNIEFSAIIFYLLAGNLVAFLLGLYFLKKDYDLSLNFNFNWSAKRIKIAKRFFSFSIFIAVSGFLLNGYLSWIQAILVESKGVTYAGFFMVAWTFSPRYLNLILNSFGTYYLPSLVEVREDVVLRNDLMKNVQRLAGIVALPLIIGMILFSKEIVLLLYSDEFLVATEIITIMLLGDYLKVASWTFGMNFLAQSNVKVFMMKEVVVTSIFFVGCIIAIKLYDSLRGIGIAYVAMYVCNLLFLTIYSIKKYDYEVPFSIVITWFAGFSVIIFAFLLNSQYELSLVARIFFGIGAGLLPLLFLSKVEQKSIYGQIAKRVNVRKK
jgi:O-antigen/teichoic acid export membrane protein